MKVSSRYFTLPSNEKMDATTVLQPYRNKDIVKKAFGNIKDRINLRHLLVSSETSLDGNIFVGSIALIHLAYIKKRMLESGMFQKYTLQTRLDRVDMIECKKKFAHKQRTIQSLLRT